MPHALLSPSSSSRWISCPPSARENSVAEDTSSTYAQQGTDAHSLCEYKVKKILGQKMKSPVKSLEYYDEEMEECTSAYAEFISEQVAEAKSLCPDPIILVEQRLDFTQWVSDSFGTADCVIIADGILTVVDFKYGLGILVNADNNPQMRMYALGALNLFDGIYDITTIRMAIFQPRRENVSISEITREELLRWADDVLVPAAKLASEGKGEYKAGTHCQFCRVKAICRKRAEYNLQLAKYDFQMPEKLEDYEVSIILETADSFTNWISDVKQYALQEAVSGRQWPGFKVVEGKSNRKYTDEKAVSDTVISAGFDPFEKKLLGITAMTKLLGKKKFDSLLEKLIEKPQGKPTLVPQSDMRPAWNTAKNDFTEE